MMDDVGVLAGDFSDQKGQKLQKIIVAIDGPAAAGKSSAASGLARRLGVPYLDSGSLYRGIAWKVLDQKISPDQQGAVERLCQFVKIEPRLYDNATRILVDGEDVTSYLRHPEVTRGAAIISAFAGVRKRLLSTQREIGGQMGVVMEGRDIGSVVFPDADMKFYLDASLKVRAMRRFSELQSQAVATDVATTLREIQTRDLMDSQREIAPLKRGEDSVTIDSSDITLDEVIGRMMEEIGKRLKVFRKLPP